MYIVYVFNEGTTFRNNVAYGTADPVGVDGNGFGFEKGCKGNLIENNVSRDNVGNGYVCGTGQDNTFQYNIAYGNGKSGFSCISSTGYSFYNNVSYDNAEHGFTWGDQVTATAKNNISTANTEDGIEAGTLVDTIDHTYNLSWGNGGDNWGGGAELTKGVTDVEADPLFRDAAGGFFQVKSTSPAIDAGADVSLTRDVRGRRVPNGIPDIGAYEHSSGAASSRMNLTTMFGGISQ
jgi:hypothetical protein